MRYGGVVNRVCDGTDQMIFYCPFLSSNLNAKPTDRIISHAHVPKDPAASFVTRCMKLSLVHR